MFTYHYNPDTKEFTHVEEAFLDPLESIIQNKEVYLTPEFATFDEVLPSKEGFAVCWNGSSWEYVEDHRQKLNERGIPIEGTGTKFWPVGSHWRDEPIYMTTIGPLPAGASLTKPYQSVEQMQEDIMLKAKSSREKAVSKIIVTVDGMPFDGDEVAQERMARTVTAAIATGEGMSATTTWVLHDNTVATVTIKQLATALRLAGEEQTKLWVKPYVSTTEDTIYTPSA